MKNVYDSKELDDVSTIRNFRLVRKEGNREISRNIKHYNLDLVLSVGYRVNSKKATLFRQWATKVLKEYLVDGYAINRSRIDKNYQAFFKIIDEVKALLPEDTKEFNTKEILDLTNLFAHTWLSLDAYDKSELPSSGATKIQVSFTAQELTQAIVNL